MRHISRRAFVAGSLLGAQAFVTGCGGSGEGEAHAAVATTALPSASTAAVATPGAVAAIQAPPQSVAASPVAEWDLGETMAFVAGSNRTVDLNDTLPAGIARGGSFSLHNSGAALPASASLGANGILSIPAGVEVGATAGIVFAYREP